MRIPPPILDAPLGADDYSLTVLVWSAGGQRQVGRRQVGRLIPGRTTNGSKTRQTATSPGHSDLPRHTEPTPPQAKLPAALQTTRDPRAARTNKPQGQQHYRGTRDSIRFPVDTPCHSSAKIIVVLSRLSQLIPEALRPGEHHKELPTHYSKSLHVHVQLY